MTFRAGFGSVAEARITHEQGWMLLNRTTKSKTFVLPVLLLLAGVQGMGVAEKGGHPQSKASRPEAKGSHLKIKGDCPNISGDRLFKKGSRPNASGR